MKREILISGFGGQGLLSLGKILSKSALWENKYTTWFPSYGAEMRGGTAHCFVKISDAPISSPLIDSPDVAIILNQPSLDKFVKKLKSGSLLILNGDLANPKVFPRGIRKVGVPLNRMALECKDARTANTAALGLLLKLDPHLLKKETVIFVFKETFRKRDTLENNLKAFSRGQEFFVSLKG